MDKHLDPQKRHDFLFAVEYINSLPNGDPDAGNAPRVDPETMHGLVTNVNVNRKIRDYVTVASENLETEEDGNKFLIYVSHGAYLAAKQRKVYESLNLSAQKPDYSIIQQAQQEMCRLYYDVRMFGAVMNIGKEKVDGKDFHFNAGQVRGPMQMTFGTSIDPVFPLEMTITRVALTDAKEKTGDTGELGATTGTMGKKTLIPYGLYLFKGHYNPHFAKQTGVTAQDLEVFWEALQNVWDLDHSSARGEMNIRGIHIFTHDSSLGNAKAYELFERISYTKKSEVDAPRRFADYEMNVNLVSLPESISYTAL